MTFGYAMAAAAAVSTLGLAGCSISATSSRVDDHTMASTHTEGAIAGRPTLSMPTPIPGHSVVVIPFAVEDRKGWFESADPFARAGYLGHRDSPMAASSAIAWGGGVRWHNAIFRDLQTREEWTVLDRRGVISRWSAFAPTPERDRPVVCAGMVFIATTTDSNGDGLLNDLDANRALFAFGDGRGVRAISPEGAQVWSTSYDPQARLVYLMVVVDTSGDGKFTFDDTAVPHVFDPSKTEPARPIVSAETGARVEQWLK